MSVVLQKRIFVDASARTAKDHSAYIKEYISQMAGQATLSAARACCHRILTTYWAQITIRQGCRWSLSPLPNGVDLIKMDFVSLADEIGLSLSELPIGEAGYLIGNLYTSMMPSDVRARLGAFYTPPQMVDRLLDNVTATGFNWLKGQILDPACGGAAFLAPVTIKIAGVLNESGLKEPGQIIRHIAEHVHGYEIDPFAAWISQVLVEVAMLGYCVTAGVRLPQMTIVADSLNLKPSEYSKYDLVIGNPPYGKISLTPELRHQYAKSLFGHANLYGLFIDLAMRLTKEDGCIAFVASSSFLGGQYFKELRQLIAEKTPPLMIDFVTLRNGVFDDVLQETVLVVLSRRIRKEGTQVSVLSPNGSDAPFEVQRMGDFKIPDHAGAPWFFPRTTSQKALLVKALTMTHRLEDYGYEVNTGQLVWNRHKTQIRSTTNEKNLPLIWAESVTANGIFEFSASRRNHKPYVEIKAEQSHLIIKNDCILVQRTTAKEQQRRIIAAILPKTFLLEHPKGVVVENHLNIIKPKSAHPKVPITVLQALLSSQAVDQVYRCISGSVAVSAYELNALPLPDPKYIVGLLILLKKKNQRAIEQYIQKMYGVTPNDG